MGKLFWGFALLAMAVWVPAARADDDCPFEHRGSVMRLLADCTTDATLWIPDGMTLDGAGHTLTAVDPAGGGFEGAVVRSAGTRAHVRRLTIETAELAGGCAGAPEARLRGILFEGASGSVRDSRVLDVQRPDSRCAEGHAIEIRGRAEAPAEVVVLGNHVEGYQKTGILAVGDVRVSVALNTVVGRGPTDRVAQNGIQLSQGASGVVRLNRIEANRFLPGDYTSTGVLLLDAGPGAVVSLNRISGNDVGIYLSGTRDARITANQVDDSTYDGIVIDGRSGPADGSRVTLNRIAGGERGISVFGALASSVVVRANEVRDCSGVGLQLAEGASDNRLEKNLVRDCAYGIFVASDANRVRFNLVFGSTVEGVLVTGAGNRVSSNLVR